jgi:hypothetical protein
MPCAVGAGSKHIQVDKLYLGKGALGGAELAASSFLAEERVGRNVFLLYMPL